MFQKADAQTWTAQSANYTATVTRNGHCGYWMVLTNKATGRQSGRLYGKHFKALESWFAVWESGKSSYQLAVEAGEIERRITPNEAAQRLAA